MPREPRRLAPVIYDSDGVVFPIGTVIGDPDMFTYRVIWSQVLPSASDWWPPSILPTVTTDRSIVLKHGYGPPNAYGVPCILSIVALQTSALCCVNIRSQTYAKAYNLWSYWRVTDDEIRTIEWDEMTPDECDLLIEAVRKEPMRPMVGGRSSEHRRAPVIYRYPCKKDGKP